MHTWQLLYLLGGLLRLRLQLSAPFSAYLHYAQLLAWMGANLWRGLYLCVRSYTGTLLNTAWRALVISHPVSHTACCAHSYGLCPSPNGTKDSSCRTYCASGGEFAGEAQVGVAVEAAASLRCSEAHCNNLFSVLYLLLKPFQSVHTHVHQCMPAACQPTARFGV